MLKATLITTSALTALAGATIAPALPAMQAAFSDVDHAVILVPLVLTLPSLFIAIGSPIAGYIVDRYGRKPLLVASTLLFGLSGASGYIAPSLITLLIGRALVGLATAGMVTTTTTLVADYFDNQARARFLGLQAAILAVIGTISLVLAGVLADIDWRQVFLIYLFAFVMLPFIVIILYEPQRAAKPVLTPLREPGDCLVEARRATTATIPEATQKPSPTRLIAFIYATTALIAVLFGIVPVLLPFYLQTLTAATAAQIGLALGVTTVFSAFAAALFGRVNARFSHVTVLVLTFALLGVAFVLFSLAGTQWVLIVSGLALSGLGLGLFSPNLNVWLMNATPEANRGRVLGGFTTVLSLGQFGAPIISQPLSQVIGIAATFGLVGAGLLLLGLVLVAARKRVGQLTTGRAMKAKED